MHTLVLLRHGQSEWNVQARFTGWAEPALTAHGIEEGRAAGRLLKERGFDFDLCFTSLHDRAIETLHLVLLEMGRLWLPVEKHWQLNERHYGALTGLTHAEVAAEHGAEQVQRWRRGFAECPPLVSPGSKWDLSHERRYADVKEPVPRGESLQDTIARVVPFWDERIAPQVRTGRRVLISGHGNSLRGLIKHLSCISDEEIVQLEIPTGQPIVYTLDDQLNAVERIALGDG